jgi:branched-chain amino acid aminotransferase
MQISTTRTPTPVDDARLAEILANPGFGTYFTDHMLTVEWTPEKGWHDARITPYGPLTLDPATAVLHYAQETFEGMKAYRHDDGSIWTFRPEQNAARMVRSSRRLAFPELPVEDFVACVDALVEVDQRWVPDSEGEKSLYLRPLMFASETFLGVRPAQHVTFMVIASPAGAYFKGGIKPVNLWLSETSPSARPSSRAATRSWSSTTRSSATSRSSAA